LASGIGAVVFAVAMSLLMAFIFRKNDASRITGQIHVPDGGVAGGAWLYVEGVVLPGRVIAGSNRHGGLRRAVVF